MLLATGAIHDSLRHNVASDNFAARLTGTKYLNPEASDHDVHESVSIQLVIEF